MNQDGFIDHTDLFSFMRDVKNEDTLVMAAYRDLNDLQAWIDMRQTFITKTDPVMDHDS